jgi:membrane protein required for colicin V production
MNDLLSNGPFTAFDLIVVLLLLVSGLMALARGFIRELASIAAFIAALFAASLAWRVFGPVARTYLPDGWSTWISDLLVIGIAFFIVYAIAAWLGQKISRLIHTATDIGFFDRLLGFLFGLFRGAAVVVLVLLATRPIIEEAQITWITNGFTYPYFIDAVIWVQNNFMVFAENVRDVVIEPIPETGTETP